MQTDSANVKSVPSVTNVFFMDCRDAGRFVRCGFGYVTFVMVPRTRHVAAHSPYCRSSVWPRTRHAAAHSYARAPVFPRMHSAAHLYAAAHQCFRALVVRPRTCITPRIHGAARLCAAAHLRI